MGSLDLYPNFINHEIVTEDQVMSCDIIRLNLIGVKVGRGDRFIEEIEQRKNSLLTQTLEKINSIDLYGTLVANNITAQQLMTSDNSDLEKLGISFFRRRKFLGETKKQVAGKL